MSLNSISSELQNILFHLILSESIQLIKYEYLSSFSSEKVSEQHVSYPMRIKKERNYRNRGIRHRDQR